MHLTYLNDVRKFQVIQSNFGNFNFSFLDLYLKNNENFKSKFKLSTNISKD